MANQRSGKAASDSPALKPYRGKPAIRNFRGDGGNVGIIEARLAPPSYSTCSEVPRRWTYGDELEGSSLGPRSVVVHLIGDIVDDAARSDSHGVVLIELRTRADQEGSGQDRDESLVGMRVRLAQGPPLDSLLIW
jgi:hypothetical protein